MKIVSLLIMLLISVCLTLPGKASEESGIPVKVRQLTPHLLKEDIEVFGKVKATRDLKVSSQHSGRIMYLNTRRGSFVKQNDVIAGIRTKKAEALHGLNNGEIKDIKIFAPISGYVVENYVSPGEITGAGHPLTRILSPDNTYISLIIPGDYLHKIKKGAPLTVTNQGKGYETKIDAVVPVTDPISGTFQAIGLLHTTDLYPGVVCRVTIHIGRKNVPAVPRQAILTWQGKQIVFVIVSGKAERRIVSTGIRTDELIEITKGVKAGESIVIEGNYELSAGVNVRVQHQ